MNKKIGVAAILSTMLTINAAVVSAAELIGEEAAQEIALRHAGISPNQAKITKVKMDSGANTTKYEVEFRANGVEYEYEIDAVTGEAIEYSKERKNSLSDTLGSAINDIQGGDAATKTAAPALPAAEQAVAINDEVNQPTPLVSAVQETTSRADNLGAIAGLISAKQAKQAALDKLPGATEQQIRDFKLDYDDGHAFYEGDIIQGSQKYEFKVDAKSGQMVKWELD